MSIQKRKSELARIVSYSPPRLYTGKEWYVGFNAFDPIKNALRRKKIKLNHIYSKKERRQYADDLIKRLTEQLRRGWNPWVAREESKGYCTFIEACEHYNKVLTHMYQDGMYREDSYTAYMSYLRNFRNYNFDLKEPVTYIYQADRQYLNDFLEHIYIDRKNSAQTRDNYLGWLKIFAKFLIQHGYHKERATDGIETFGKRSRKKQREYIPEDILYTIRNYVERKNKHFLLAMYVLFYMLIRPKEMSKLQIRDINVKKRTIVIKEDQAKNHKEAAITLPVKLIHLMIELKTFDYPGSYYLFSNRLMPGESYMSEKQFRDFWIRFVRKDLKLPEKYKFYSLKDTGVTMMLRGKTDILSVRDQARHSSILITDTYTPHDLSEANPLIDKFECEF
ncbi:MAG: site-specific integrase [Dysgonamonadaceae bacterium]|jgi:site-specific recombinase XerD|nr:site-specific integrase [Dysgonamonadaceae bacterium]